MTFRLFAVLFLVGSSFGVAAHAQSASDIRVDSKKAWSTLDGFEQYALLRNDTFHELTQSTYIADALDDRLTAIGRFGFVARCLDDKNIVQWAICQPDIDAFDAAKVTAEIDADHAHPAGEHAALKAALVAVVGPLADRAGKVKDAMGKDDAYKKMFELAASARKAPKSELRDLALAMDDARTTRSRKALAGCEDTTWPAWQKAVAAIPAKSFALHYKNFYAEIHESEAATIVADPNGYLAAVALTACFSPKGDQAIQAVQRALVFWPGYRGPRNAAQLAIMNANLQLDDRDAKIDYPRVDRRELFTGDNNGARINSNGSGRAPIVSVTPNGAKTTITFGPTKTKVTKCADYRPGKHLSRIESDGRLVYEGTCMKYEQVMVTNPPPKPIDTPSRYATSVKAGMIGAYVDATLMDAAASLVATTPSVVFGVPVR